MVQQTTCFWNAQVVTIVIQTSLVIDEGTTHRALTSRIPATNQHTAHSVAAQPSEAQPQQGPRSVDLGGKTYRVL